ncbi:hypothetical protein C8A00DRAFT_14845, partial [Chaetomidium leptoderma]
MPAAAEKKKNRKKKKQTRDTTQNMSKLSPSLKALINAPFARPGQAPAPRHIRDVYTRIAHEARERKYGERPWVTLSVTATFTLNSPASLLILHDLASSSLSPLTTAQLIREIGLKCISFNGIPRTINCLGAFKTGIAHHDWATTTSLTTTSPSRAVTSSNVDAVTARGRALWKSIYTPLDEKLEARLAESHPDLPVHILGSHYGPLLADPPPPGHHHHHHHHHHPVGRSLTSVVAISCLRAQTGVGPQVLSHVFGLRKGVEQGLHLQEFGGGLDSKEAEAEAEGVERLAEEEGCEWLLRSVD